MVSRNSGFDPSDSEHPAESPDSAGRLPLRNARLLWILAGVIWVLPAVVVFLAVNLLPDTVPPGQCEGLGFGCTPAPNTQALLLGYLYYAYAIPGGIVVLGLTAVILGLRNQPPTSQQQS